VTKRLVVQITANFERNLEEVEHFLTEADAPRAYDHLLDELLGTVIPNLESFPDMGRPFLVREAHSVESTNALERLHTKLLQQTTDTTALREYILSDYLVLYVQIDAIVYLLAIRHHRQLAFDFVGQWGGAGHRL
jgi:plasmid stabilization system protein ParE